MMLSEFGVPLHKKSITHPIQFPNTIIKNNKD